MAIFSRARIGLGTALLGRVARILRPKNKLATYLDPVLAWSVDMPECGPSMEGMNSILSHLNVSVPFLKYGPKILGCHWLGTV